ncbi:MAG: PAN domain-containing protein [Nostoc sp.]|uniref:PAN domain-containing protein n=1 Tax=Nostoc sp. TaxID=1180 RepID=UPI002FF91541
MKVKMIAAWHIAKKIFVFPKNILFFGLVLLLILGFSTIVNFTPLAQPAVAQTGLFPTTLSHYAITAEFGRDRSGSDYISFANSPSASACQQACLNDNRCSAYSYNVIIGPGATCFLKSVAPVSTPSPYTITGVKL